MVNRDINMAICSICGAFYDTYTIYDLDADEKAVSYICRDCFLKETAIWDVEHNKRHNVVFKDDKAVIQLARDTWG